MLRGIEASDLKERAWKCQATVKRVDEKTLIDVVARRCLTFCVTRAMMASSRRLALVWSSSEEQLKKLASRSERKKKKKKKKKKKIEKFNMKTKIEKFHICRLLHL
jgi:hypothetical protein